MTIYYQRPFKGKYAVGTPYGKRGSSWKCGYHSGQDYASLNHAGDGNVYPIAEGRVVRHGNQGSSGYGLYLHILHPDGYLSLYAHLAECFVTVGAKVTPDTVIGIEGSSGNVRPKGAGGRHLHIEIHKGKYSYPASINPDKFIQERIREVEEEVEIKKLSVLKDGKKVIVEAVEVEGSNYIKLRDMEQLAPITVGYNAAKKQVSVTTKK